MTLASDIVEYLRGERRKMTRQQLCVAIVREASHNAAWPKATHEQWEAAIAAAVKAGELVVDGDMVSLAVKPVAKSETQMELF